MDAWEILVDNSTIQDGDAWEHLINQGGEGGGYCILTDGLEVAVEDQTVCISIDHDEVEVLVDSLPIEITIESDDVEVLINGC